MALAMAVPASASGEEIFFPQVAVQPDGRAHFAWDWSDGRAPAVQERWRTPAGAFSETQWVSPANQGAVLADLAVDADGDASVVWLGAYGPVVRMRVREADGTLHPTQTISAPGSAATDVQAAVDPAGNTYVTWVELTAGGSNSIVKARRRAADGTLGPIQTLSAATGRARFPRVAVDAAGNAVYAWPRQTSSGAVVVELRRRAAGGTLSAVQALSATTGISSEVDLGLDADGAAVVSWLRRAGGATGVQVRRRAPDGALTAIQALTGQVADGPHGPLIEAPRMAVAPDGAATVAWLRYGADDSNRSAAVRVLRRGPGGGLSTAQTLNPGGSGAYTPRIATDPRGNATVVWVTPDGYGGYVAQARRRTAAGGLGPLLPVSDGGIEVSGADVGMDAAGNAIVAYVAHSASGRLVEAVRVSPGGSVGTVEPLAP